MMNSITRRILFLATLVALPVAANAEAPTIKVQYVGAISIDPCQDAKVLADWYAKFGIETTEFQGGYYGQMDTAAGPFVFGIHPKKKNAPEKSSASVAVVLRVEDFGQALLTLKEKGLEPEKTEEDDFGKFAHFHDPDGNKVSIWGK